MSQRVLVTGHRGYIGSVLVAMLRDARHRVVGLDAGFFDVCTFGEVDDEARVPELCPDVRDIRDVQPGDLVGFDAVIHLAALSNDPLGRLDPALTCEINHRATVRLASLAKAAGVPRFLYSSSCSLYGAADGGALLDEDAPFNPVTAYGASKVAAEQGLSQLADGAFSPTYLRNATAYGVSPRLRGDLVINELVALAHLTGEIELQSDGTPWRPLVHVEDISRAFLAALQAPRDVVHDRAFNVGRNEDNYRVGELAEMVRSAVPGSRVTYAQGAGPDARSYRVDFSRIAAELPRFEPRWTVPPGIEQLHCAYREHGITLDDLHGARYTRLGRLRGLMEEGRLDAKLRWRAPSPVAAGGEGLTTGSG